MSDARGRLERLERLAANTSTLLHTLADAFRQERTLASRERRELRGKVERVIALQGKMETTLVETKADVAHIKPLVEADEIKGHRAAGARALWKKQWGIAAAIAAAGVGLLGLIKDWWPWPWQR